MIKILGRDQQSYAILTMIAEARNKEARRAVAQLLRTGAATPETLAIAADMIEPPRRPRGRPRQALPAKWYEVGSAVDQLRGKGIREEAALVAVGLQFGIDPSTVRERRDFYDAAMEDTREEAAVKIAEMEAAAIKKASD